MTDKTPYSTELKNMQSTTNIEKKTKRQKSYCKYQVSLSVIRYLADNNLAYISHISIKAKTIIEMT